MLETVRDLPKVHSYLHVPAQSGSDAVLKRMKRGYTVADYYEMMDRIHDILPEAAVASDFIVGFCGETEDDFQQTMELVRRCRFKNSFIFQYSVRPALAVPSSMPMMFRAMSNRVATSNCSTCKMKSACRTISAFSANAFRSIREMIAFRQTPGYRSIATDDGTHLHDRIVVWDGNERQTGQMLDLLIHDANSGTTLFGNVETVELRASSTPSRECRRYNRSRLSLFVNHGKHEGHSRTCLLQSALRLLRNFL
ncbi:MAG: radical SAM protein [Pirellulaceae bacterium]